MIKELVLGLEMGSNIYYFCFCFFVIIGRDNVGVCWEVDVWWFEYYLFLWMDYG